jgi:hypothetical protein
MKKSFIYFGIIILMFIGYACEKTIEIDLEDAKIRIVANAILTSDSIIRVNVTRSRHILDNAEIIPLSDAVVKLFEDDAFIGDLTYISRGYYEINYHPVKGKTYKIEVEHDNFNNVSGQTTIPFPISISSIDTTKSYDEYGDEIYNFNISFSDPAGAPNYYLISIRNRFKYEMWDEDLIVYDTLYVGPDTTIVDIEYGRYVWVEVEDDLYFYSEDLIIEGYMPQGSGFVFSDELIDGENYSLRADLNQWSLSADTNMVYIELHAITKDYYNYVRSLEKHYNSSGDPFAEPVNVFTNITDGIGIIGSSAVYRDSIQIISNWGYHNYDKY